MERWQRERQQLMQRRQSRCTLVSGPGWGRLSAWHSGWHDGDQLVSSRAGLARLRRGAPRSNPAVLRCRVRAHCKPSQPPSAATAAIRAPPWQWLCTPPGARPSALSTEPAAPARCSLPLDVPLGAAPAAGRRAAVVGEGVLGRVCGGHRAHPIQPRGVGEGARPGEPTARGPPQRGAGSCRVLR